MSDVSNLINRAATTYTHLQAHFSASTCFCMHYYYIQLAGCQTRALLTESGCLTSALHQKQSAMTMTGPHLQVHASYCLSIISKSRPNSRIAERHHLVSFNLLPFRWVRSVAVEPGNQWFATGSADRTIKIWDLATGQLKLTLTGHIEQVHKATIAASISVGSYHSLTA